MKISLPIDVRFWANWAWGQLAQVYPLVVIPVAVCLLMAVVYILTTSQEWKSSQSLIVRDDLLGDNFKPGRFSSMESQKNAQETLLHIARKPMVIRVALRTLGPVKRGESVAGDWFTEQTVEGIQSQISIVAPNGAEFGKTDVIVLNAQAVGRDRARFFVEYLTDEIESHLREIRENQLHSMQNELRLSVQQVSRQYDLVADKVRQIEQSVGSDLPTLRNMIERGGSPNDVQRSLEQVRTEIRAAQAELDMADKQLEMLNAIENDPSQFLVTSSELLNMQPIFKRLREGLTDAQLRLTTDSGKYTSDHPAVEHDRLIIEQTKQQIGNEIQTFIQGLQSQKSLAKQKLARLADSERAYDERLTAVGKHRVEYEILANELQKRGETLGKAKTDLAEMQSLAESVKQVSLITRVGEPHVESRPLGWSKKALLAFAMFGGLIIGGGLVALSRMPRYPKTSPDKSPISQAISGAKTTQEVEPGLSIEQPQQFAPSPLLANKKLVMSSFSAKPEAMRPYGMGSTTGTTRPATIIKQVEKNTPEPVAEEFELIDPSALSSVQFDEQFTNLANEPVFVTASSPELTDAAIVEEMNALSIEKQLQGNVDESPAVQEIESDSTADVRRAVTIANRSSSATVMLDMVKHTNQSDSNSGEPGPSNRPAPPAARGNTPVNPVSQSPPKRGGAEANKTVDLRELKRSLAEAAAQSRPGQQDSIELRAMLDALEADPEHNKSMTQRLDDLSLSISAYCEPIRKKPRVEGKPTEPGSDQPQ